MTRTDDFLLLGHLHAVTAIPLRFNVRYQTMKGAFYLNVIGQFAGHLCAGIAMFFLTLLGAIATKQGLIFFEPWMGGQSVYDALHYLETFLLWADLSFLAWWVVWSTFHACRSITKHQ